MIPAMPAIAEAVQRGLLRRCRPLLVVFVFVFVLVLFVFISIPGGIVLPMTTQTLPVDQPGEKFLGDV